VVLVDTAGRLAIDAEMMAEIKAVHAAINPEEFRRAATEVVQVRELARCFGL
jgi:signal recognition particle GTPase